MEELWRDLERADFAKFYQVSNLGRVRRKAGRDCCGRMRPERVIRSHVTGRYRQVLLSADRVKWMPFVHRLVAAAFLPREIGRTDVNHRNGNKLDNRVENLEWVSKSENQIHAAACGLLPTGERSRLAKLTALKVLSIRARHAGGEGFAALAAEFSVTPSCIFSIVKRKSWKQLQPS